MPYLIDGNNLIGAIRDIDIRDPAGREKLTRILSRYQKAKGNRLVIVFDGPPPDGVKPDMHYGSVRVMYAGPESDADSRIRKFISNARDTSSYIVVSSDKQVYSYCKWAGAKAMRAREFYTDVVAALERQAAKDSQNDGSMKEEELDDWLEYFGLEDNSDKQ
jgi:predicted RNA-binding protein with PIN domain